MLLDVIDSTVQDVCKLIERNAKYEQYHLMTELKLEVESFVN